MTEIVASAVASEVVSRISSSPSGGGKARRESFEDKAERLEMAVLKIRSIVAVAEDLQISHLPLLQWKAKLKRIAKEGDDLLHVHKKRLLECSNSVNTAGTTSSLSQHLIHVAKRFVPFWHKEDYELGDTTLRRFERLADGANSFIRLLEFKGQNPKTNISMPSLTRSLLAGNSVQFCLQGPSSNDIILLWPCLDGNVDNGLEACFLVASEDEVMWQRNVKMMIVFRLSEDVNILAITRCLEVLPPQFGAACVAVRRLLNQTIAQGSGSSCLSQKMMWCRQVMQDLVRSDCDPVQGHLHCPDARMVLPEPVLRLSLCCYALPMDISRSPLNSGFPVRLRCHVSPYLLPEKHSREYLQVEQNLIWELLPKVTDGFYDPQRQAPEDTKEIWCPQTAMYCSVAPTISQPLTLSKEYMMETSSTHSSGRRRRRRKRMASHGKSKLEKISTT